MSRESLEQFRAAVRPSKMLQDQLKATDDAESFIKLLVKLGEESGYSFNEQDVAADMRVQTQNKGIEPSMVEKIITNFRGCQNIW